MRSIRSLARAREREKKGKREKEIVSSTPLVSTLNELLFEYAQNEV